MTRTWTDPRDGTTWEVESYDGVFRGQFGLDHRREDKPVGIPLPTRVS